MGKAHTVRRVVQGWILLGALGVTVACSRPEALPVSTLSGLKVLSEAPNRSTSDLRAELPPLSGEGGKKVASVAVRRVGERTVHRFFGTFTKGSLLLSEEVLFEEGAVLVVEYKLEEGDKVSVLRARRSAEGDRLLGVYRLVGDREEEVDRAELGKLLERITFVPERTEAVLDEFRETCVVGARELDCALKSYQVSLVEGSGTMTIGRSTELGRDVSGEVRMVDGTLVYRAELIELRAAEERSVQLSHRAD